MNSRVVQVILVLFSGLLPIPISAQCSDPLCRNLQTILDEALTDFREYRVSKSVGPDLSNEETKVPCGVSIWANNVPMYICYAQVPFSEAQKWYARAMQALQSLNPTWHFEIRSPGDDRYVDAGPPDCEIPPNEGPYIGQCPLHLQMAKQADGTAKLYFWMNSLTSAYLLKRAPGPPAKTVAPAVSSGCDDFCQNLKKAFEARASAFEEIQIGKAADGTAGTSIKLNGAKECRVNEAKGSHSGNGGTQFVCYWEESTGASAEARFRDLTARLQILIPSNWTARQGDESDDFTGAGMTAWSAEEPGGKHDLHVYVSGVWVGLHITAWK
jgi:hypothetical protein